MNTDDHDSSASAFATSHVDDLMLRLAALRPVFHSEADFQHAVAWELHRRFPEFEIRLELPIRTEQGHTHLDLLARSSNVEIGVELKYKTRELALQVNGEEFLLANHAAQDLGRYDFFKDVSRLEKFVSGHPERCGYALFLTNDSAYWTPARKEDCGYAAFAMHDQRDVSAELAWGLRASAGTRKKREATISLLGSYGLRWVRYSSVNSKRYPEFRYLCIETRDKLGTGIRS